VSVSLDFHLKNAIKSLASRISNDVFLKNVQFQTREKLYSSTPVEAMRTSLKANRRQKSSKIKQWPASPKNCLVEVVFDGSLIPLEL